jgi:hypothetical protein
LENINSLKEEFDKFVAEKCITGECDTDLENPEEEPDNPEDYPYFVEELATKLLNPEISGINLSRIDLKRISDTLDEGIAIQSRKRMLKALTRHKRNSDEIKPLFDEIKLHLNSRILIYKEISDAFKSSSYVFENYTQKVEKSTKMLDNILENYSDIDSTAQPINLDSVMEEQKAEGEKMALKKQNKNKLDKEI